MKTALIVLGHGSRAPEATETLAQITRMVREKTSYDEVAYAALQISEPGLEETVASLAAKGMQRILVVPFLIAVGLHVKEDIPEELNRLKEKHPELSFVLGAPLGADERLADIVTERAQEMEHQS